MNLLKHLVTRQWPFWLGGLLVGIAEIIYYYRNDMFIVVTTGFAQMYATSEHYLLGLDWVARVYEPHLFREGWIVRTPHGRAAAEKARRKFGTRGAGRALSTDRWPAGSTLVLPV